MFNVYALIAGIAAASMPTKIVTNNKIPSFSQAKDQGLKLSLNSCSVADEIKCNAALPTTVPTKKPTQHKKTLSAKTRKSNCNLLAPEIRISANSYLRSLSVL